jgi:predicted Zn finger-like uncharacterized protein
MKFVCERCQTKYSIADEKVRQKVLKIRCKTCENVITIRDAVVVSEPAAPRIEPPPTPAQGGPPAASGRAQRSIEWHLAISGHQTGPFGLAALVTRILAAGRGDEVYVWNEHLDGWKEPKAIPEVAAELELRDAASAVAVPPPRRPTSPGQAASARPSVATQPAPILGRGGRSNNSGASLAAIEAFGEPGEDEKTQISALDASMLAGDPHLAVTKPQPAYLPAARSGSHQAISAHAPGAGAGHAAHAPAAHAHAHAPAPAATKPLPAPSVTARRVTQEVQPTVGSPQNNGVAARKSGSMPATGLEALDFSPALRAPSRSGISAVDLPLPPFPSGANSSGVRPAPTNGAAAPVNGGVTSAVLGGTTSMLLSQVGGRAPPPPPAGK